MKLFAVTIFLGAFLLFQVQPLIAKFILPWFGGTPAVWTTCMMFFQVGLLGGYAYAHGAVRYLSPRRQAGLHVALLLVALATLPIVPGAQWKPGPADEPTRGILLLLTACLGLPYFVLAATGPLLQAWFTRLQPGTMPYRLYALSNAGSLLALVSFPFLFEPWLTRQVQANVWAWCFGAFALLCGVCAWRLWRAGRGTGGRGQSLEAGQCKRPIEDSATISGVIGDGQRLSPLPRRGGEGQGEGEQIEEEHPTSNIEFARANAPLTPSEGERENHPPSRSESANADCSAITGNTAIWPSALLWFMLPLCGSVLLLATTNKLCQDVAVIPFLWVLPLSLYLVTFILCFDRPAWYARRFFTVALVPLLAMLCHPMFVENRVPLFQQIAVYCGTLFAGCMVCHGEVYRRRPSPRDLTSFYLLLAAGGAAGGLFVAVVAPLLFRSYAELNWGIGLLAVLLLGIHAGEQTRWMIRGRPWRLWPVMLVVVLALGVALLGQSKLGARGAAVMTRNFYGVLRILPVQPEGWDDRAYVLNHGDTMHGLQFAEPAKTRIPTLYYGEWSGVGLALDFFSTRTNRHVGLVGLGVGTLAAYGRKGDTFRFYEINPGIRELAESGFRFLRASAARVEVRMGDARLVLENEPPQQFDLLVLDAFNSDAIPIHLLTQEAFALYLRHLKPDGAIAVHISNRHLDLYPVTQGLAAHFQLGTIYIPCVEAGNTWWLRSSDWVLLSRNERLPHAARILSRAMPARGSTNAVLWSDDYTSLFPLLKR